MPRNFTSLPHKILLAIWILIAVAPSFAQTKKIDSLLIVLAAQKSEVAKIPTLRLLSQSLTAVDPDKKYVYAKQMYNIAVKHNIDSIIPLAYLDMAMVHGIKTNYDSSMYYFSKGLTMAKDLGVESEEARAYVGIGYTFDRLDDPKSAIKNYELALKIFKKTNNKRGLNQTNINLGSLYFDLFEYKIAESYFLQALKSYQKMNDQAGIAYGYFILGNSSRELDKDEEAYEFYSKSLAIREKLGDVNGIALANYGLGELYLKKGKLDEAKKVLEIAIANNQALNNKYQETISLNTLTNVLLKQNDIAAAKQNAESAYKKAMELKSWGITAVSLERLVFIEKELGNYKKAFDYQTELGVTNDSLNREKVKKDFIYADFKRLRNENNSLESINQVITDKNLEYKKAIYIISLLLLIVVVLLVLYFRKIQQKNRVNQVLESQKKEISTIINELENLNEELVVQNELITSQKLDLERINSVKNKFFSVVSHDLRSPIATLKMLFNTYFSGQLTKDQMDDLLKKLQKSTYDTADFLDNLLEWSKSQLEGMMVNAESFQIQPMLSRTLEILSPQLLEKQLLVYNNLDHTAYAFADKNMINVVLRNLMCNSIKFCAAGDTITVNFKTTAQSLLISIEDTGIGITPEDQLKIFQLDHSTSQGTSGEQGHHIGLVLCKDMVEQNKGKIWFESTLGVGTTFYIEIPKADF